MGFLTVCDKMKKMAIQNKKLLLVVEYTTNIGFYIRIIQTQTYNIIGNSLSSYQL